MIVLRRAWCGGLTFLLAGCSHCHEDAKPVHWSGEVVYPEYTSGQIQLVASEGVSQRCSGDLIDRQTPGMIVGRTTLERPDPFALSFVVRGIDDAFPEIVLRAFVSNDPVTFRNCTGGAMLTLPPNDASDLSLLLEPGKCVLLD